MIVDRIHSRWWLTLNGLIRHAMVYGVPGCGPSKTVLTEYPRSGGTWVCQMIAEYLGIANTRNRLPPRRRCVIHGHYPRIPRMVRANDIVVMWRDGRDVMVSFYYYVLFERPTSLAGQAEAYRRRLSIEDAADVRRYLPRFIEHFLANGLPRGSWLRIHSMTWPQFVDAWKNQPGQVETSYEAMSANASCEMGRIVEALSDAEIDRARLDSCIAKFSFEKVAGRARGEEKTDSFARKGVVGDWKSRFSREAREIFDHYAGQALIELGYEADRSWIDA